MHSNRFLLMTLAVLAVAVLAAWLSRIPIKYVMRNLLVRWRTTLLTSLAFTLVVALLTVMLAFVNGMYALTESSGQPDNVIVLSEGSTDESFSNLGFSDVGDIERQTGVARNGETPLCSKETYVVINQPIADPPPGRPRRRFLQLRGVDDPAVSAKVHAVTLYDGGAWFSDAGVQRVDGDNTSASAIEVVVGEGIARELGRDRSEQQLASAKNVERLDVGDLVAMDTRRLVIVGVAQSAGSTFDSEVWAKRSVIGPLFGKETYTSLVLKADDAEAAGRLAEFFNTQYTKASLQAYTEPEYFRSLGETNRQFLVGIIFVAIVMAIGGIFGVMNTMFAAISQRVRDIGVLRLLGFSQWRILIAFLAESLMIAVLGGAIGCALGYLANGWTATSIVSSGPGGGKFVVLRLVVDLGIVGAGMFLSVMMGLLGGFLPSCYAVLVRPLDALR
ncbi:MAG: ABC transporter permease [Planctomycetales bacterium]|nr:ABC transporter permease [Planctomycetales bacterium]